MPPKKKGKGKGKGKKKGKKDGKWLAFTILPTLVVCRESVLEVKTLQHR